MPSPSNQSVRSATPWNFYDDLLYKVTAGFNLFLKGLFNGQEEGNYKWLADQKLTEIVITDQQPISQEVVEKRPAIVTIRGPARWANLGLNQMENYEWHSGKTTKLDLVSCHMTFACLSRNGVEAHRLAWFLFVMIPLFKPHLQKSILGLHNIGNAMSLGGETQAGALVQGSSSPEWKMVQVTVPLHMSHMSSIEPLDKVWLDGIIANITALSGATGLPTASPGGSTLNANTLTTDQINELNEQPPKLNGVEVQTTTTSSSAPLTQQAAID